MSIFGGAPSTPKQAERLAPLAEAVRLRDKQAEAGTPPDPTDPIEAFLRGEWLPVTSSNVAGIGWDAEARLLTVGFFNGSYYQYPGIDRDLAEDFARAPSKGKWVWANLRRPEREFVRLTAFGGKQL